MKDSGVYAIISPSGKRYIGSAKNCHKRWQEHLRLLRRGEHHSPALQRAFDKYGEAAMHFSRVEIVAPEDLLIREQANIDAFEFDSLYNVARQALGPMTGRKHTDMTRALMRQLADERMTPEVRNALSETRKSRGLKPTREVLEASAAARRGKPLSEEHKAKLSAKLKGRVRSADVGRRISAAKANSLTAANTSGVVGVSRHAGGKWKACVHLDGRSRYLGLFDTVEAAARAIESAKATAVGTSSDTLT